MTNRDYYKERYRKQKESGKVFHKKLPPKVDSKPHIIIRADDHIDWEDELNFFKKAEAGGKEINFYIEKFPSKNFVGKKCYISHRTFIKGYHLIIGVVKRDSFVCEVTGRRQHPGWYIVRNGKFHTPEKEMKVSKLISSYMFSPDLF